MDPKKKTFPKTLAVRRRNLKPGASQKRHLSSRKRFPTVLTYSQTTWQERTDTESVISGGEGHTLPGSACSCILLAFHLPINPMSGRWRWTWGTPGPPYSYLLPMWPERTHLLALFFTIALSLQLPSWGQAEARLIALLGLGPRL